MLRRVAVLLMVLCATNCARAVDPIPKDQVVWYMISPPPSAAYPEGDMNSSVSTWERIDMFPSAADCQQAELKITHDGRPVDCIASDDIRLQAR